MNPDAKVPNAIPPITHPYGAYWKQPHTADVLLDDKHALMTAASFYQLAEYSCSIPTGVYEGKMWRRRFPYGPETVETVWRLCWYGPSENPDNVSVNSRIILLV